MKFLSPEVALYIYQSTTESCMKYYFHVWAGASSRYLDMLSKLQKWVSRTVVPSLVGSVNPLAHFQNISNLSLFNRYYFGTSSCRLAIQIGCIIFFSLFLDIISMYMPIAFPIAQPDSRILCLQNAFL